MNHKLISFLLLILGYTNLCIAQQTELPYIKHKDGRHCLMVDGKPFLMLGAQCNNSSAWPDTLPQIWSAMEQLKVNTLEIPIYWEQFEPQKGQFDYSVIDTIITQAREHNVRVVLLWFATWKNGSNHYMPGWMKQQPEKYPNMINKEGQEIDSPSPHAEATLNEDVRAFSAFMKHLKEFDKQHTVIMVQVQNEPGAWGSVRDYSNDAQKIFDKPVPKEVLKAVGKNPKSNKNWKDVFGNDADEFFQVWHVAQYIGKIAQAGKDIYPLPLYVNAAIRNPINPGPPYYQIGGPNDNVFELWRAAAPAVDVLAPDIYFSDTETYLKAMELYARGDNPLFVPETFWHDDFPKFFYSALGYGAIGYAPFGLDDIRIRINKKGEVMTAKEMYEPTAINFELFAPMASEIARLNFEGKIQTAVQLVPVDPTADKGNAVDRVNYITDKTLHLKSWDADVAFGTFSRLSRSEFQPQHPDGRFLIAELSENQFLVCGYHCRVMFKPSGKNKNSNWQYLTVEEGHYENGVFKVERILNGDQTDWGLNFDRPKVLRVTLYTR